MGRLSAIWLSGDSKSETVWDELVQRSWRYDFYHLSGYHLLAQENGEGKAVLILFEEGNYFIALPLLLRPISQVRGLESFTDLWDATSVYGYAGPVYSHPEMPRDLIHSFQEAVSHYLQVEKVVTVFSRLHPLIPQQHLLQGLGSVVEGGVTVSMDLTIPPERQRNMYRKNHKYNINRLRRLGWQGISCRGLDCEEDLLGEFINIYWETMDRVRAKQYYYFDQNYFKKLIQVKGAEVWIFAVHLHGEIGAAGIFTLCNGIVQYHLGGTKARFFKEAPMKLVFDEVRLWANNRGAAVFHLGGGVGGREDSLFAFKAGFSDKRHRFLLWKWIINQEAYDKLCEQKGLERERNTTETSFFPAYRSPES